MTILCEKLSDRADVTEALAFRGALRPPGEGSEILHRAGVRPARYDVVVMVRTVTVAATDAVRSDPTYHEMVALVESARHDHVVAAANAARIADVDHSRDHWFLFNYFHCADPVTVYDVWEYTAGWFQAHTALPDSTLLRPLPGQPVDYNVVNHASWPMLRTFPAQPAVPAHVPLVRAGQLQGQWSRRPADHLSPRSHLDRPQAGLNSRDYRFGPGGQ